MAQGNYDHPAYLARLPLIMATTAAGAAGTGASVVFPFAMRVRTMSVLVATAGTIGTNVAAILLSGTGGTLGSFTFGTGGNNANTIGTMGDINQTIAAGTVLSIKNGADATAVTRCTLEAYLDPAATWTGPNA